MYMDKATYLLNLRNKCNNNTIDISSIPVSYPGMSYDTWYKKSVGTGFTVYYPSTVLSTTYIVEIDIGINSCISNPPNTVNCIRFADFGTGIDLTAIPDTMAIESINSLPISTDYTIFIVGGVGIFVLVLLFDKFYPRT